MKTLYSMGRGKYITLDSYGESHETRRTNLVVAAFAMIIACIAIPAALGIDITNINQQNNGTPHRTSR